MCAILCALFAFGLAAPSPADEKSHLAAAEELLKTMNVDTQLGKAIEETLDIQIKADPRVAPLRPVMKEFFEKYMSWETMKDDLAKIYAGELTESEINEITAFYRTPTGKKLAEKTTTLLKKGMDLGIKRVQDNKTELQDMIRKALDK
jgi:hypothetical protein